MTNQLPPLPDDNQSLGETAPNQLTRRTQAHPRQPTNYNIERVRKQRQQRQKQEQSLLYFPLWSLGLMLLVVMILAFIIVFLVVILGGNTTISQQDPIIQMVTQGPTNTPDIPDPNEIVLATPTLPAGLQVVLPAQTPVNLTLDGPILPTIALSNTPIPLSVGIRVAVSNVDSQELNIRDVPGVTSSQVLFRAVEGTQFIITDGPQQADGFTWWQIQNVATAERGWAVANYLSVVQVETGQ